MPHIPYFIPPPQWWVGRTFIRLAESIFGQISRREYEDEREQRILRHLVERNVIRGIRSLLGLPPEPAEDFNEEMSSKAKEAGGRIKRTYDKLISHFSETPSDFVADCKDLFAWYYLFNSQEDLAWDDIRENLEEQVVELLVDQKKLVSNRDDAIAMLYADDAGPEINKAINDLMDNANVDFIVEQNHSFWDRDESEALKDSHLFGRHG